MLYQHCICFVVCHISMYSSHICTCMRIIIIECIIYTLCTMYICTQSHFIHFPLQTSNPTSINLLLLLPPFLLVYPLIYNQTDPGFINLQSPSPLLLLLLLLPLFLLVYPLIYNQMDRGLGAMVCASVQFNNNCYIFSLSFPGIEKLGVEEQTPQEFNQQITNGSDKAKGMMF